MMHVPKSFLPWIAIFFLAFSAAAAAQETPEKSPGAVPVSPELMAVLEAWSEPDVTLETLAVEKYPEALTAYAKAVASLYGGGPIADALTDDYPGAVAEFEELMGEEAEDVDFVAYFLTHPVDDYGLWQQDKELRASGLGFDDFMARNYPDAVAALAVASETPASRGELLVDFAKEQDDEALYQQALALLERVKAIPYAPSFDCHCWLAVAWDRAPFGWTNQRSDHTVVTAGPGRRQLDLEADAKGAAREVDFYRLSRHQHYEAGAQLQLNYTTLRVRLHCTEGGVAGGRQCRGSGCSGEMAARVLYGSRVSEEVSTGPVFPRRSTSLAADEAELTHVTLGSSTTLFSKGGGVAGNTRVNWDPSALSSILQGFGGIVQVATGSSNLGALLSGDLLNAAVEGIFGLIVREGEPGSLSRDWFAEHTTTQSGPIVVHPNVTHDLRLETRAEVYGKGFGWESESVADIDGAYSFAAVFRNFSCTPTATAPPPAACWSYATRGQPLNLADLRSGISGFVGVERGWAPASVPNDHCE